MAHILAHQECVAIGYTSHKNVVIDVSDQFFFSKQRRKIMPCHYTVRQEKKAEFD